MFSSCKTVHSYFSFYNYFKKCQIIFLCVWGRYSSIALTSQQSNINLKLHIMHFDKCVNKKALSCKEFSISYISIIKLEVNKSFIQVATITTNREPKSLLFFEALRRFMQEQSKAVTCQQADHISFSYQSLTNYNLFPIGGLFKS